MGQLLDESDALSLSLKITALVAEGFRLGCVCLVNHSGCEGLCDLDILIKSFAA